VLRRRIRCLWMLQRVSHLEPDERCGCGHAICFSFELEALMASRSTLGRISYIPLPHTVRLPISCIQHFFSLRHSCGGKLCQSPYDWLYSIRMEQIVGDESTYGFVGREGVQWFWALGCLVPRWGSEGRQICTFVES
jgi:hypothetical protein